MNTVYHSYHFDVRTPEGKAAYAKLRRTLKAGWPRSMCSHGGGSHYQPELDGAVLTLETKHLFDNQWNATAPDGRSFRVFDWAVDYNSVIGAPEGIKRGHYLDQTADMREVRRNTVKCRYCGAQEPAQKGYVFCPHCLDSEHLGEKDLRFTRMLPVDSDEAPAMLTEAERAHLLPLFRDAQIHGATERGKARLAEARRRIVEEHAKAIADADQKRDAATWIMDRAPGMLSNWIFYPHTGKHCFGWRKPLSEAMLAALLEIITEFPFAYDIKCEDGRTLSGY